MAPDEVAELALIELSRLQRKAGVIAPPKPPRKEA